MQKRSPVALVGRVVVLMAICAACNKQPTPTQPAPTPTPNGAPALARLEIAGPDTIAPGTRVNYKLTGFLTDGTSRDVTAEAEWRSSNVAAATIDQSGGATGNGIGETMISAILSPQSSRKNIVVMPEGTFKLMGSIVEEGSNLGIHTAQVEVRDETGLVLRVTTFVDGGFRLLGVPGDAELRVTHEGYAPHTQRLHLSENSTVQVRLKLLAPGPDLSGTYTLTLGTAQCPGAHFPLADSIRQRTYTATVTHIGSKVDVALSGVPFATVSGKQTNGFTGRVLGTRATFVLSGPESQWYYYYSYAPDVAERLADGTFLVSSGTAELTVSGSRWDGVLNGNMRHLASVPGKSPLGRCSGSIALTLVK
jgi:hypothetical protein